MSTTLQWLDSHTSTISIADNERCCINCKHFIRHYVRQLGVCGGGFVPINLGHCTYPRCKDRRAEQACGNYDSNKRSET